MLNFRCVYNPLFFNLVISSMFFSINPRQDVKSYIPSKVSYGEAPGSGQDGFFFSFEVLCCP